MTDSSSKQFEAAYTEFNTGATKMIQGLTGMGQYLDSRRQGVPGDGRPARRLAQVAPASPGGRCRARRPVGGRPGRPSGIPQGRDDHAAGADGRVAGRSGRRMSCSRRTRRPRWPVAAELGRFMGGDWTRARSADPAVPGRGCSVSPARGSPARWPWPAPAPAEPLAVPLYLAGQLLPAAAHPAASRRSGTGRWSAWAGPRAAWRPSRPGWWRSG